MHLQSFLRAARAVLDVCSPGTFCATQILSGAAGLVAALAPVGVEQDQFVWLWRGVITASIGLNLFFLRSVYKKVQRIGPHNRAIATLQVAVEYLAVEAIEHGVKRQADAIIVRMLNDVKKLVEDEHND
jgi:hypothetical protein